MKKALVLVYLMLFFALPALADDRQLLIGVWKLQTFDYEFQDTGEHIAPFGAHPNGISILVRGCRAI